ncbi:helix-turn-helix domain-containing protein [Thomasclavelia cocleata]|uniref:helix-turn-helix domain-containing protein n=1 Tax=Thomasclavelia cocleata TaxID=69824 RepID=UPI0024309E2B|nr:helix-turn-helix transcriptional regulator [Thomasclavelia cocleata]
MAFSTYLKSIRVEREVNQTQMAEILDISRTAIKLIENGSTKYPSKKVLHNLSQFLNEAEIDVMSNILFDDNTKDKNELFIHHYLSYMYLDGWNIVEHPYTYSIWNNYNIEFDGKIVKKRQPKNIMIVTSYKREQFRVKEVKTRIDALGYVGDLVSKLIQVIDLYRGVKLIFNAEDKEEKVAFKYISEVQINHKGFNIEVVLYDENIGVVDNFKLLQ